MSESDRLRAMLDELGIEHHDYDKGGRTQTLWEAPDAERYFCFETEADSKTSRLTISWFPTAEQAIAATLGKLNATGNQESIVRSFLRKISPNRDWDYLGEHEHAMIADFIDDIAASLGDRTDDDGWPSEDSFAAHLLGVTARQDERIAALEALVRDMFSVLEVHEGVWRNEGEFTAHENFERRMRELGVM